MTTKMTLMATVAFADAARFVVLDVAPGVLLHEDQGGATAASE